MKRLFLALPLAMVCLGSLAVPAKAGTLVTFIGRVNVPARMVRAAGPDAGPPTVELLVEPSWRVERAADAAGELVSVSSVARATATPSFSLSLDLGSLDPRFVADEGYVNVLVAASYGGRVSTWGVSVWPGEAVVQVPAFDMSRAAVPPGAVATRGASSVDPTPPCGAIVWGAYNGPYETKIMDVMNAANIPSTATYANGGSTSTTLGFLTNGPNWTVGGTMTTSSSSSTGFSAGATNQRIQALWEYRERAVICIANQNVPYNYYGRGSTPSITHVNYSNCGGFYYPGEQYFHQYNDNQTYSAGLTVYGISLSSKAGYSSTARLEFTFQVRGKVCGSSATLGEASPKVDARPM